MIFSLDFSWLADPLYVKWLLNGLATTLAITFVSTILVFAVGICGAAAAHLKIPVLAPLAEVFVDLFRNTPPLVQLFFLYFMLSGIGLSFTDPVSGNKIPLFSGFACVVLSLALYNGAIAIEVIRSGFGAVPEQTIEGARSLGFSRRQIFMNIELPMALRLTIPGMTSNIVSLIKTSAQASLVAVTDVMYYATQIMLDSFLNLEVMMVLWLIYLALATVVAAGAKGISRVFRIPGFGT